MSDRRLAYMIVVLAAGGCHSLLTPPDGGHHPGDVDMSVALDLSSADLSPGGPAGGDMACTPTITSCAGLCGPIPDPCLGKSVECGGCGTGQICNLATHVCEAPKSTCTDLGAGPPNGCGNVRNSCGTRIFCGDCAAGKQCNNDQNSCVACNIDTSTPTATIASCRKLGFQCGQAWLGCGPRDNLSNCGTCATGLSCNLIFNTCEPTCTPPDKQTACAAALANKGIQCGVIDDGCGGAIDCGGCAAYGPGLACGAQGDPGLCEPFEIPVECATTGRNCGTITSLCGGTVNCGSCTSPQVCNPNGVCGPPCTPLKCSDLKTPPMCGTVPDGCGGPLGCGNCPDPVHYVCKPDHTCCKKKDCKVDYAGKCGKGLDDGCGGTMDCGCASGRCTTVVKGQTGTCCVNTAKCPANSCNTTYTDTCTGQVVPCTCDPNTQYCDKSTSPGTCKNKLTCLQIVGDQPGKAGDQCSNGPAFDAGGGNLIECQCGPGGLCIPGMPPQTTVVTGNQIGTCCFNTNSCAGQCNGVTVTNSCTGVTTTCSGCNGFCQNNLCQPFKTCGSYGANGNVGDPCSTGNVFGNGDPNNPMSFACPCNGTLECSSGGVLVGGTQMGTCCQPPSCNGQCNVTLPDPCGGPPVVCSSNCGNGFFCGTNNMCQPLKTCANYQSKNPPGAPGDACGTFSNGNGGTVSCPCDTGPGFTNNMCVGGTCACNVVACTSCTQQGQSDSCGGSYNMCACPHGDAGHTVCDPNGTPANVDGFGCCQPYSASHLPPGWPAQGSKGEPLCTPPISDGCGGSFSIACPATNPNGNSPTDKSWRNVKCVVQAGGYGLCECTADSCPNNDTNNDGCGNVPMCHS